MRSFAILFLLLSLSNSCSDSAPGASVRPVEVSGVVLEVREYCGGAAPAEEILAELRKKRPLAGKKLFVRPGEQNSPSPGVLTEFTSGADGRFSLRLPPGAYCIIEERRKNDWKKFLDAANKAAAADPSLPKPAESCLRDWWQQCDFVLRVGNQPLTGVEIISRTACAPPCVFTNVALLPSSPTFLRTSPGNPRSEHTPSH